MASNKGDNLSNPTCSCERVFTAIFCCSCQTDHELSDHEHEQVNVSTRRPKAEVSEKKQLELPKKPAAEKAKATSVGANNPSGESKDSALTKGNTFSEYIYRAKMKIRTMSNIGHGKDDFEADVGHDHHEAKQENNTKDGFSEYINRAKMKIRKTSSVGSRSQSLQRE